MPRVYSYPARHACDTLILSWRCSPQSDSFISHRILSLNNVSAFVTSYWPRPNSFVIPEPERRAHVPVVLAGLARQILSQRKPPRDQTEWSAMTPLRTT